MIKMLYQVVYVGPAQYDGSAADKQQLSETLQHFQAEQNKNADLVVVKPSYILGLFVAQTRTRESAEILPLRCGDYERSYGVVEV